MQRMCLKNICKVDVFNTFESSKDMLVIIIRQITPRASVHLTYK